MRHIWSLINRIIGKDIPTPLLGRWKIDNCINQINNKIDLSNEDHCGPCGQYSLKKLEITQVEVIKDKISSKHILNQK